MIEHINNLTIFGKSAQACSKGNFFEFPTWFKYLDLNDDCAPLIKNINDIWLILLAIVEMLIRLGVILAIIFVIYGAVSLIIARGTPEKVNTARDMIIDAMTGLVIGLVAIALVSFIGKSIS